MRLSELGSHRVRLAANALFSRYDKSRLVESAKSFGTILELLLYEGHANRPVRSGLIRGNSRRERTPESTEATASGARHRSREPPTRRTLSASGRCETETRT